MVILDGEQQIAEMKAILEFHADLMRKKFLQDKEEGGRDTTSRVDLARV